MECPKCNATLLVDIFQTPSSIRCPSCGAIVKPINAISAKANRYAWRSFWLGLFSIILLCFAGFPAIWYGVRSLLDMRYTRSQKHDRKAAVAGISMGVLFGVFGSGVAALAGAFALTIAFALEETKEPERVLEISQAIASIEIPEDFHPVKARQWNEQYQRATFRDGAKVETANGRIRIVKAVEKSQFGEMQFGSPTVRFDLHDELETDSNTEKNESLSWFCAGKNRSITKTTSNVLDNDFEEVRYVCILRGEEWSPNTFALIVTVRQPGKYSEDQVAEIFKSFQPAP